MFFKEKPVSAPNKSERAICWEKRDLFFDCLTSNQIDNSLDPKELKNVESKCGHQKKQFESNCVSSWIQYFQEKRYNDLLRKRYIEKLESEGAQPLPFKIESIQK